MALETYANLVQTTLSADVSSTTATSITVTSSAGMPAPNFRIKVDNELMQVTGVSGTTLTVVRGIENTTAATHTAASATVKVVLTAAGLGFFRKRGYLHVAASDASDASKQNADYVCDGVADDVEINAALNSLTAGGKVILSVGSFVLANPITLAYDNQILEGQGTPNYVGSSQPTGGTRISPVSGYTAAQAVLVQLGANNRPLWGVTLRDFMVDGQGRGTACDGIVFRANHSLMDNVHAAKCTGTGIRIRGYDTAVGDSASWATYDTRIIACSAWSNSVDGFHMDHRAEDLIFTACISFANGQDGWSGDSSSEQVIGCHFYDNTRYGAYLNGGTRTKFIGCKIEGNNGGLYNAGAYHMQVVGCGFKNNSAAAQNTTDDIQSGNYSFVTIVGNAFMYGGGTGAQHSRYGVNITGGAAWNVISGNTFSDTFKTYGTSGVNDGGSASATYHTVIRGNAGPGLVTENSGQTNIASGATSVVVNHGCTITPRAQDIMVTPSTTPASAGTWWVDTIGATSFTLHCTTAPSVAVYFNWQVARLSV